MPRTPRELVAFLQRAAVYVLEYSTEEAGWLTPAEIEFELGGATYRRKLAAGERVRLIPDLRTVAEKKADLADLMSDSRFTLAKGAA